jgi:hypothetical protein
MVVQGFVIINQGINLSWESKNPSYYNNNNNNNNTQEVTAGSREVPGRTGL